MMTHLYLVQSLWLLLFVVIDVNHHAFTTFQTFRRRTMPGPFMAKGFNKARNKQAELAKKMANAKQKKEASEGEDDKDRELFEKLLNATKGALPKEMDTNRAFVAPITAGKSKTKQKKKKPTKPKEAKPKKDTEEDKKIAQRIHFESLLEVETSAPLGPIGAAQLVPWVPPYLTDCLIVFVDPRPNSVDLRQTVKFLTSSEITEQVICITADATREIQSWLTRNKLTTPIRMFSDPQLEWMTTYKVLGNDRWSMAMLVFDTKGRVLQLERNIDPSHASKMVLDTIEKTKQ